MGVALTQLVRPGAPAIYGNFLSSMALRSGSPTFGMPEPALGSLIVGQLARRVGRPALLGRVHIVEGARRPSDDGEHGQHDVGALRGANFILHSAGWLEGGLAMGYEQFMMDLDLRCSGNLLEGCVAR